MGPSLTPARSFPHFNSLIYQASTPAVVNAAVNATYTPAQVLTGMIFRDPQGGVKTDTLPTARDLAQGLPGVAVGTTLSLLVRNEGGATVTIAVGAGGTASGSPLTVLVANNRVFRIRFTNVTPGSEAYTLYTFGTVAF